MKKIAIMLDSFSGKNEKEIKEIGFEFVPQVITLNENEEYKDGSTIILKNDFQKIYNAKKIRTSMPPIGDIIRKFEILSQNYEIVIFLPMNKGMSSTYSTAFAAAKEFKNVYVINNKLCGTALIDISKKIIQKINDGNSIEKIINFIQKESDASWTMVIPKDVSSLIKSGRLTGAKKIILEKAKLIPQLYVSDDGFEVKAIKRNFQKTIKDSYESMIKFIKNENISKYNFEIIHCGDEASIKMTEEIAKEFNIKNINIIWAPCAVAGHSGKGAIGINAWKK